MCACVCENNVEIWLQYPIEFLILLSSFSIDSEDSADEELELFLFYFHSFFTVRIMFMISFFFFRSLYVFLFASFISYLINGEKYSLSIRLCMECWAKVSNWNETNARHSIEIIDWMTPIANECKHKFVRKHSMKLVCFNATLLFHPNAPSTQLLLMLCVYVL